MVESVDTEHLERQPCDAERLAAFPSLPETRTKRTRRLTRQTSCSCCLDSSRLQLGLDHVQRASDDAASEACARASDHRLYPFEPYSLSCRIPVGEGDSHRLMGVGREGKRGEGVRRDGEERRGREWRGQTRTTGRRAGLRKMEVRGTKAVGGRQEPGLAKISSTWGVFRRARLPTIHLAIATARRD